MNQTELQEIIRIGGDLSDTVWSWFLSQGPHGNGFTWSQTKNIPPAYSAPAHLRENIANFAEKDNTFISKILQVAQAALASTNTEIVRRGLHVLGVVGGKGQIENIKLLTTNLDSNIAADARACLFEIQSRVRCEAK